MTHKTTPRATRQPLRALLCLCLALHPSLAAAQAPPAVKLSALQLDLMRDAARESERPQPDYAAVQLNYEAALSKGEADVLYAGLGRALYRQGRCPEALAAYQKALTAPRARDANSDNVRAFVEGDLSQMRASCPGALALRCDPPDARVTLQGPDRAPAPIACGQTHALPAGAWTLRWDDLGQPQQRDALVTALETLTLELQARPPAVAEVKPPDPDPRPDPRPDPIPAPGPLPDPPRADWPAWALIGAGGALLLGGGLAALKVGALDDDAAAIAAAPLIDVDDVDTLEEDADLYEALQFTALGLGGASLLVGALLLWLDAPPQADAPAALAPWWGADQAGLQVQGQW